MALIGVNPGSRPERSESTFDKVVKGLSLAGQLINVGTGLKDSFTKAQEANTSAELAQMKKQEAAADFAKTFEPIQVPDPSLPPPNALKFKMNGQEGFYKLRDAPAKLSELSTGFKEGYLIPLDQKLAQDALAVGKDVRKGEGGIFYTVNPDAASLFQEGHKLELDKIRQEIEKSKAETAKIGSEKNQDLNKQIDELSNKRSQSESFQNARKAIGVENQLANIEKNPSAAGDLAIITVFNKALDPRSTVRENEFNAAAAAGSFGDRVQASYNSFINGQKLSPVQRADLLNTAKRVVKAHQVVSLQEDAGLVNELKTRGVDPSRVIREYDVNKLPDILKTAGALNPEIEMVQSFKAIQSKDPNQKQKSFNDMSEQELKDFLRK